MMRKADGTWRPCGDFRRLNMVTVADSYPLPNMLDFAGKAAGCTIFSKIDLGKGYHQIPVHPADIQKTAITTDEMDVASRNAEEHAIHLRQLFTRLREHRLVINVEKCVFRPPASSSWATTSQLKGWSRSQRMCRR
jgi:hypothetical protein